MRTEQTMFAVTIAFFIGAFLISGVLYLLVLLGIDVGFATAADDWVRQGTLIAGLAALFGFSVDAIRYLATIVWRD